VQELATAISYLRRRREPKLQFGQVFKKSLVQLLEAFESELSKVEEEGHNTIEVADLREAIPAINGLKDWRDPRIHARVSVENGIALFDWKTRKQLAMTAVECERKCNEAVSLAIRISGATRSLLSYLKADEALVSEIQILLDSPDLLH
jgi:hypothetical protein